MQYTHVSNWNRGIAIGPILFVVAILAVLVGALAAGSGGFGSSTADDTNRVNASVLIQQATSIKSAFDRVLVAGAAPAEIVISPTFTAGQEDNAIFSPTGGGLTAQNPPSNVVPTTGVTTWRFVPAANLPGIGSSGANDYALVVQVRSIAICRALNSIAFGRNAPQATTIPAPGSALTFTLTDAGAATDVTGASTTPNIAANTFNIATIGVSGRSQGCVSDGASTPSYYYYQLLTAG